MTDSARKPWLDLAFGILWSATFLGTFELLYDLSQLRPSVHPIWSGVFGFPFLHHIYYVELGLLVVWVASRWWWEIAWAVARMRST